MDNNIPAEGPGKAEDARPYSIKDKRGYQTSPPKIPGVKTPDPEAEPPIPPAPEYEKIGLAMQGDRMLLQNFPHAKKIGHIYTPDMIELQIDKARVCGIGPEVKRIKVGDIIFKCAGLGQMLKGADGNEYVFLPENAAIAIDTLFEEKANEPILPGLPDMPSGALDNL